MSAPTVQALLRQLDARRAQEQVAELAALDSAHRDEVRRVLAQVKPTGRVDIAILIESVRKTIAARSSEFSPEEREAARATTAHWRAECERHGITEPAARYGLMLQMQAEHAPPTQVSLDDLDDLELDDDLDDEVDDAPPRRRSMSRKRLRLLQAKRQKSKPPRRASR